MARVAFFAIALAQARLTGRLRCNLREGVASQSVCWLRLRDSE